MKRTTGLRLSFLLYRVSKTAPFDAFPLQMIEDCAVFRRGKLEQQLERARPKVSLDRSEHAGVS